jgi:hypothetical protein
MKRTPTFPIGIEVKECCRKAVSQNGSSLVTEVGCFECGSIWRRNAGTTLWSFIRLEPRIIEVNLIDETKVSCGYCAHWVRVAVSKSETTADCPCGVVWFKKPDEEAWTMKEKRQISVPQTEMDNSDMDAIAAVS